ncbi:MAG: type I pullulanase [Sumerlaeia bacterium]
MSESIIPAEIEESIPEPAAINEQDLIKIHYHRFDDAYSELTLWTWDCSREGHYHAQDVAPAGKTDFGVYFLLDPKKYIPVGNEIAPVGLLPRRFLHWDKKDAPDRIWHPQMGNEVWLLQGRGNLYLEEPDTTIQIAHVFQDDWNLLRIVFGFPVETRCLKNEVFEILSESGKNLSICTLDPQVDNDGKVRVLYIKLDQEIPRINSRVTVRYFESDPCPMMPGNVQYKKQFYTPEPLGAQVFRENTHFRAFSPAATAIQVVLYSDPWTNDGRRVLDLVERKNGIWELEIPESLEGWYYSMVVKCQVDSSAAEFRDPFCTNTISNPNRARLTNLYSTDPKGFRPVSEVHSSGKLTDAIIYEAHVRDFTIHPDSGVEAKGSYHGMVEPNTHLQGNPKVTTGYNYLKDLGITHLQLLPVHQFDLDELNPVYNWGYMTAAFFSPCGWFASGKNDASRIHELKTLIKEFHSAGIGVVLDIVINHSGEQNTLEQMAPRYYHRTMADGSFWNGSGCGNEIHSETPMGRQLVKDCCRYWVCEYGVDGFRFDLMGLTDLRTLTEVREELQKIRSGILVYGEPWVGGPTGRDYITDKAAVAGQNIGAFNDVYRNAIKGEPEGFTCGYVQNGSHRDDVIRGLQGSIYGWAKSPQETINYVTCHDNLTLWDKITLSTRDEDIDDSDRQRMHLLSLTLLCVSQGALFIHGGSEFLRSKDGQHNSYNAPDWVNQFDWVQRGNQLASVKFMSELIKLRRNHPIFRLSTAEEIRKRLIFKHEHLPVWSAIHLEINGEDLPKEPWSEVLVLVNPDSARQVFNLPERPKPWKIICFDYQIWHKGSPATPANQFSIPSRSLCILAQGA